MVIKNIKDSMSVDKILGKRHINYDFKDASGDDDGVIYSLKGKAVAYYNRALKVLNIFKRGVIG